MEEAYAVMCRLRLGHQLGCLDRGEPPEVVRRAALAAHLDLDEPDAPRADRLCRRRRLRRRAGRDRHVGLQGVRPRGAAGGVAMAEEPPQRNAVAAGKGIERLDPETNQVFLGGRGNIPRNAGSTAAAVMWAPRIGLAYRANEKTVFRGGFGLSYGPLVPLLTEKDDTEVQWHAKHGIVLMVAELFFWLAVTVVQMIMPILLGCFVGLLSVIVWLGVLGLHIACIAKGISGQRLIVPGVTPYVDRF